MTYELYRSIFMGAAVMAAVMLMVTIILFVVLKIPVVLGNITGINRRKSIARIQEQVRNGSNSGYLEALMQDKPVPTDKLTRTGRIRRAQQSARLSSRLKEKNKRSGQTGKTGRAGNTGRTGRTAHTGQVVRREALSAELPAWSQSGRLPQASVYPPAYRQSAQAGEETADGMAETAVLVPPGGGETALLGSEAWAPAPANGEHFGETSVLDGATPSPEVPRPEPGPSPASSAGETVILSAPGGETAVLTQMPQEHWDEPEEELHFGETAVLSAAPDETQVLHAPGLAGGTRVLGAVPTEWDQAPAAIDMSGFCVEVDITFVHTDIVIQ